MSDSREFQPRKASFLFRRILAAAIFAAFLSLGLVVLAAVVEMLALMVLIPVVFIGVMGPAAFAANVAYGKERYEIHPDHLICNRGTLLSDGRTELDIHNITHVRLRLPFLRHRLFGIGDVRVESAGSAASEITFESIIGPEEVYDEVLTLMRNNGYSLQRNETLHEESPGVVGALTDLAQVGIGGGFSALFLFSIGGGVMVDMGLTGGSAAGAILMGLMGIGGLSLPLFILGGLVVRYLDMTRRTYTVYDDAVAYTEGFLTRDNAVIPFENIADASTNRTFVDQMLGLYDVKVSCQGSGSEITFRRLSRGEELKSSISSLVAAASKKTREVDQKAKEDAAEAAKADPEAAAKDGPTKRGKAPTTRSLVDPDAAWTATLKMNPTRAQIPLLTMVPVFPLWIMAAIGVAIKASQTTYTIGPNSMASDYTFIGASQQEFAYDKVTGVQIERNPLDGMFNTVSVQIWSIGSPQPLSMPNLNEAEVDLPALLRQCGIPADDEAQGELKQSFGPKVWLIQNVFIFVFLALCVLGLLIAAIFAGPLVLLAIPLVVIWPVPMAVITRMRVAKQRVSFHKEHLEAQTGIFFRKHIYARYDSVKKVETTQIPLTTQGTFKVYIAGEQVQQNQNGQDTGIKIPYSLQGGYIEDIAARVDATDALMLGLIEPSQIEGSHAQDDDVLSVSKPAIANSIVPLAIIGIFFPPLWLLLPVVIWQTKVRSYSVESDRVVERGGIFFKYVTSVLFNRIDSLQQNQGALGKAFGNGQVTILTAGSSSPDLVVANVPDYTDVYATIRKNYGKA